VNEVTGESRRRHSDQVYDLRSSSNIVWLIESRKMGWAGHVVRMGGRRSAYRVLVGRSEGRRPLGRPWLRRKDNIKMEL
jgi:hypothetical protein